MCSSRSSKQMANDISEELLYKRTLKLPLDYSRLMPAITYWFSKNFFDIADYGLDLARVLEIEKKNGNSFCYRCISPITFFFPFNALILILDLMK